MELGVTIPPFIRPDHPADDSRAGRRSPTSGESERRGDTPCDLMLPARQTRPRLHHHLGESDPLRYLRAGGKSPMRVRVPFHQRGSNCVHSSSRLSPLLPPPDTREGKAEEQQLPQRGWCRARRLAGCEMENATLLPHAASTFSSGQARVLLWAPRSEFYLYPSCETRPRI